MSSAAEAFTFLKNLVWGIPLLALLLGTGIYLTFCLRGMQFRYLPYALKLIFAKEHKDSKGDISHFQSLMASLAGAIGTGTIVGVATAIAVGGLGALFWMWVTAFFGMATKYAESLLAVRFRQVDEKGEMAGGPMHYMALGLGWKKTAALFAAFGAVAAIGTGNLVQVNSIAEAVNSVWQVDSRLTGIILALLTGWVLLGGVKSMGQVAGVMVPVMALLYIGGGVCLLVLHSSLIPEAFLHILWSAFNGQAAAGGFAGSTVMMALQMGVARSVFSNEAGLGISTMAAAAAKTDSPPRQAMISMTGAWISTVVVCSVTGLVLAVTQVLGQTDASGNPLNGAAMAIRAFSSLPGGPYVVTVGLILFAYSTVIAWAYYGEKCFAYLFGLRSVGIYRILFTGLIIPGTVLKMRVVWDIADIANGLMALPNLLALVALTPMVVSETAVFLAQIQKEESQRRAASAQQ